MLIFRSIGRLKICVANYEKYRFWRLVCACLICVHPLRLELFFIVAFQVAELQAEADRLQDEHDDLSVEKEKDAINDHWERVTDAAKKRKKDLDESYDLQVCTSAGCVH